MDMVEDQHSNIARHMDDLDPLWWSVSKASYSFRPSDTPDTHCQQPTATVPPLYISFHR